MHLVTAEEMRALDRYVIERIGLPGAVLMENAARAVAEAAMALGAEWYGATGSGSGVVRAPSGGGAPSGERYGMPSGGVGAPPGSASARACEAARGRPLRWLVLAGKGNNGGDGIAAARHLLEMGAEASILYAEPPERLSGDAALQRDAAARLGIPAMVYEPGAVDWRSFDGIIDALLGTGSRGAPREPYASLIREANASGLPIVAADIPSGLDADTGAVHEPCIRAARTVALAFMKRGLALYPGAEYAGAVTVAPIGIPARLADAHGVRVFRLDEAAVRGRLGVDPARPRRPDTHKGTYGRVLVAAGSPRMAGAGLLCVRAALRAGCGLATWALPAGLAAAVTGRVPEAMLAPLADGGRGDWSAVDPEALAAELAGADALVLGPGLGRFAGDAAWLRRVWDIAAGSGGAGRAVPFVLDADALNMLAEADDFVAWPKRPADSPAILTPHPGEMARLTRTSTAEVQRDRIGVARDYAARHGVVLVLKGAATVTALPDGTVYVNTTGNPGMATGGSGDVLAGVIGSLLAQGMPPGTAAAFGVWLHGLAGDRAAAARPNQASLIAGDIIEHL
ncbi:MAG: bifunctional ADP-dependent (S)-NAD(P)H-hydrate dehydratase/NAD(P)H-hydrate epimerase [Thermobacillus sp. ZCTH02-B1]|uniref:NAD(P)H-hydrate dehydratase n=1 Tax=Thermobacillus sp. ZCTH02-B1 TaxID=1858795 RepID=UPI000B56C4B0|nr:NAD(P)H-hydrate dehydratase [Thermobacillus sp. ZCTH02-B1]OUM94033.1 MAG: bifunctional ADP-dependent (S)-NAD(P)H-hydrate dehydratase/NAD(P)H-hydrate epimerase [Thermobacillus sp. ZCTH02-B1]